MKAKPLDKRLMTFYVAEIENNRDWKTVRGSPSACWAALGERQEADPLECQLRGWRVIKCEAHAVAIDRRFEALKQQRTKRCKP